ncbi:hypothetical protein PVAP13_9KG202085 [Panicum virgatum]|uniref:Expansin n=1 Tax=Panicum virgatum TaxID=38727 RepID=A0A8T0NIW7_PANVG|nr:hypothetical protein PVAP13_9KG202085 [Panicum virgatum]
MEKTKLPLAAVFLTIVAALLAAPAAVAAWSKATATFYGGSDASGTMGGACGYGNLYTTGYGTATTALSQVLFSVVRAVLPDRLRRPDGRAVVPPGRRPRDGHGHQPLPAQLRASQQQRRLVQPAAGALRHGAAGLGQDRRLPGRHHPRAVPSAWRALHHHGVQLLRARAHLQRRRQRLRRHAWVQGTSTNRVPMSRNWGANWQSLAGIAGQALTFGVTTTGGQTIVFQNVVPPNWSFGMSFMSNLQFSY